MRKLLRLYFFVVGVTILLFIVLVAYLFIVAVDVSCRPISPSQTYCARNQETQLVISIAEAAERGFPIYLPSPAMAQTQGIVVTPTITMKSFEETCSFLIMDFLYKNDDSTFASIHVSNGCAMPLGGLGFSEVPLNWARDGTASTLTQSNTPILAFTESTKGFLYVVFPEEGKPIMQFLEAMKYYEP